MVVTIRSIAKAANVSRGAVERALNGKPGVSPEVREYINNIAKEMGYKPNVAGKALACQKNPIKIGFIILNEGDPTHQEVYEGVKKVAHELDGFGTTIECRIMKNTDVKEQLRCIRELRDKNISALAISPLDEEIIKKELNQLAAENIKIVTYITDIADIQRLCFVGQDLKRGGRVAAGLMGNLLPNGGNILIISGPEKIKALKERVFGFTETLKSEYPLLKIAGFIQNIDDNEHSYKYVKGMLERHSDINGIFITARGIGGAGRAIKELNRKDIKMICFDKVPETLELLKDNTVNFTITQDPVMQGYLPVKILFDCLFNNKMPESEQLFTKLEIITKESIF